MQRIHEIYIFFLSPGDGTDLVDSIAALRNLLNPAQGGEGGAGGAWGRGTIAHHRTV